MTVQHYPDRGPGQTEEQTEVPGAESAGRTVARVPGSAPRDAGAGGQVVTWIGWHLGELTAVAVPSVLAVTVHPMWIVPAGLAVAAWAANEARVRRRRVRERTGQNTREVRRDGLA